LLGRGYLALDQRRTQVSRLCIRLCTRLLQAGISCGNYLEANLRRSLGTQRLLLPQGSLLQAARSCPVGIPDRRRCLWLLSQIRVEPCCHCSPSSKDANQKQH